MPQDIKTLIVGKKTIKTAQWEKTNVEYYWYNAVLPIGTVYKAFETENFGYVVLETEVNGHRAYRY